MFAGGAFSAGQFGGGQFAGLAAGAAAITPPPHITHFWDLTDSENMSLTGALVDSVTPVVGTGDLTSSGSNRLAYDATAGRTGGIRCEAGDLEIPTSVEFDRRDNSIFVITTQGANEEGKLSACFHATYSSTQYALYVTAADEMTVWDSGATSTGVGMGHGISVQWSTGGATNAFAGSDNNRWEKGSAYNTATDLGGKIGRWSGSNFPWTGSVLGVLKGPALTPTQVDEVLDWINAHPSFGAPASTNDSIFIFDGDSITEGIQDANPQLDPHATDFSFPAQFQKLRSDAPRIRNCGQGGAALQQNTGAAFPKETLTLNSNVTNRVVFSLWGNNDINGGRSIAQLSADIDTWIAAIRAHDAGAIVSVGTILPSTGFSAAEELVRVGVNDYIKHVSTGPDIDFYIDTAAATGVTKVDGVHPDSTGYAALASYVNSAMTTEGY